MVAGVVGAVEVGGTDCEVLVGTTTRGGDGELAPARLAAEPSLGGWALMTISSRITMTTTATAVSGASSGPMAWLCARWLLGVRRPVGAAESADSQRRPSGPVRNVGPPSADPLG